MTEFIPAASFKQAASQDDNLAIAPDVLAWFKQRGTGWQDEMNGVLEFYRDTVEHPASVPDHEPTGPELSP
jgi:uncharacterized protein (DUF4415 family)